VAHRFCYLIVVGERPKGLLLDHLCRVRGCVNPTHLMLGENARYAMPGVSKSGTTSERRQMRFNRIKGKDKPQNIIRLPRLGRIRLGIKKVSERTGNPFPVETDYLVCPDEVRKIHGERPRSLPVMLPVEDEALFLNQSYRCYKSNHRMRCHGNGETAERITEDGKWKEDIKCPSPPDCEYGQKHKCKSMMDLMVVLPAVNMGGVYQVSTGSINADIDIRSGIEMAKSLFGRISWTPMKLSREEMMIPDPETGKMQKHWPCRLHPVATMDQVNKIREDTKRIIEIQGNYVLAEPEIEATEPNTTIQIEELPAEELSQTPMHTESVSGATITAEVVEAKTSEPDKAAESFAWTTPDMGKDYADYLKGMSAIKEQLKKVTGDDSTYYMELAKITKDMPKGPFEHANKMRKLVFRKEAFDYLGGIAMVVSQGK